MGDNKRQNIYQVTNIGDLKHIVKSNFTVILGITCPHTTKNNVNHIKQFLKRKSKLFPLITFVYLNAKPDMLGTFRLIPKNTDDYPIVYHIRDGNKIGIEIKNADIESINESFNKVEKYYLQEMDDHKNNNNDDSFKEYINAKNTHISKNNKSNDDTHNDDINDDDKDNDNDDDNNNNDDNYDNDDDNKSIDNRRRIDKLVLLNKKFNEMQMDLLNDVANRKEIEENIKSK